MGGGKSNPGRRGLFGLGKGRQYGAIGIEAGDSLARIATRQGRRRSDAWDLSDLLLGDPAPVAKGDPIPLNENANPRAGTARGSAICALTSQSVAVFPLSVRQRDSQPVEQQVVRHAQEHLGGDMENSVLDYSVLPVSVVRPGSDETAVLVFAAPREMVTDLLATLEKSHYDVERLLTPACALAPWVTAVESGERHLLISTAEETTSVSITQQGHVLLERMLPWGIGGLVLRMGRELDLDEGQCRLLLDRSWLTEGQAGGSIDLTQQEESLESTLRRVLEPDLQELAKQAAGCLGYCDSFYRPAPIAAATLVGPLAEFRSVNKILQDSLGFPVRGPSEGLTLPGLDDRADAAAYTTAACCALWPEKRTP